MMNIQYISEELADQLSMYLTYLAKPDRDADTTSRMATQIAEQLEAHTLHPFQHEEAWHLAFLDEGQLNVYGQKTATVDWDDADPRWGLLEAKLVQISISRGVDEEVIPLASLCDNQGQRVEKRGYALMGIGIFDRQGRTYPAGYDVSGQLYASQVDADNVVINLLGNPISRLQIS